MYSFNVRNAKAILARINLAQVILLSCSLVANVALAISHAELRNRNLEVVQSSRLSVGESVPDLPVRSLDGRQSTISFSETAVPTLVYFFYPDCSACRINLPNVEHLARFGAGGCRVVGVSLEPKSPAEYVVEHRVSFPVFYDPPFTIASKYRVGATPQSVLVSPQGTVLKNWIGTYEGSYRKEIEAYFSVALPGVAE